MSSSMNTTKPYHIFSKSSKSFKSVKKVAPASLWSASSDHSLSLSMPFIIPGESKAGKSKSSKSSPKSSTCSNSTYHQLADIFDPMARPPQPNVSRMSSKVSKAIGLGKSEKHSPPKTDSFRLRLYWEDGYRWQGSPEEMFFCMESNTKETNAVYINECDSSPEQQWIQVEDTIRPQRDTNLCMTVTGVMLVGKPVRLVKCDGGDDQKITGVQEDVEFELQPTMYKGKCFTQHHHPCADEVIYPEDCEKARRHKTSFWGSVGAWLVAFLTARILIDSTTQDVVVRRVS